MIKGYADLQGTIDYFNNVNFRDNWSVLTDRYQYSKLGLGTFIGDFSDENSRLFKESITYALLNGVNFIDTAINYRGMRSERDIGFVITKLIKERKIMRSRKLIFS